jgi:putative FmdB family regulatory protein
MPVYEYACGKCGHEFEVSQRITDEPIKTCPVCRSRKVKRLISQTSFVLKGGGWYSDLYSSSGKGKEDPGAKEGGGESASEAAASAAPESQGSGEGKNKPKESRGKGKGKGKKSSKAAA